MIDWHELRDKFFDECTYWKEIGSLKERIFAFTPSNLFAWFKRAIETQDESNEAVNIDQIISDWWNDTCRKTWRIDFENPDTRHKLLRDFAKTVGGKIISETCNECGISKVITDNYCNICGAKQC